MYIASLLLWLGSSLAASGADLPRDEGARVERVSDDVYVILHDDASDEWPHGNTGIVIGRDSVLLVDTTYLPSHAQADVQLLRRLTDKPVRYLVYTHWHMDHNNGAVAWRRAFPDLTIVSETESARWTVLNQAWYARMSAAPGSARRAAVEGLRGQLATASDADRPALARTIAQRERELTELAGLEVVGPDLRFERSLQLKFDDQRIEIVDRGRGNSPHDVTVWLPRQRVLFTGDLLVQAPLPFTGASWPVAWTGVLEDLESIDAAAIVPGHGPVQRDHAYTRAVRELIDTVLGGVQRALENGLTLEQAQGAIDVSGVRSKVAAWSDPVLDADFRTITDVLVERAWRGVRGQG